MDAEMNADEIEDVMGQCYAAFGQGTGPIRVQREAIRELRNRYRPRITPETLAQWDTMAVQALERVRAIGRLATIEANSTGRTAIARADLLASISKFDQSAAEEHWPVVEAHP